MARHRHIDKVLVRHVPQSPSDPDGRAGCAFCYGYIRGRGPSRNVLFGAGNASAAIGAYLLIAGAIRRMELENV
jgi:hypothetical protein